MKREDLFQKLEPPPGGLAKLRARARMDERPRALRRWAPLAIAAALALIVLLALTRRAPDFVSAARQSRGAPEIELGLAPMPNDSVEIAEDKRQTAALTQVPTSSPKVVFYWIGAMD